MIISLHKLIGASSLYMGANRFRIYMSSKPLNTASFSHFIYLSLCFLYLSLPFSTAAFSPSFPQPSALDCPSVSFFSFHHSIASVILKLSFQFRYIYVFPRFRFSLISHFDTRQCKDRIRLHYFLVLFSYSFSRFIMARAARAFRRVFTDAIDCCSRYLRDCPRGSHFFISRFSISLFRLLYRSIFRLFQRYQAPLRISLLIFMPSLSLLFAYLPLAS